MFYYSKFYKSLLNSNVLFNCLTNASLSQQNRIWMKIGIFTSIMTFWIIPNLALLRALISDNRTGISWSSAGIIDKLSWTNAMSPFLDLRAGSLSDIIAFIKLMKFIRIHFITSPMLPLLDLGLIISRYNFNIGTILDFAKNLNITFSLLPL